jgi:sulfatase modifying factor 1
VNCFNTPSRSAARASPFFVFFACSHRVMPSSKPLKERKAARGGSAAGRYGPLDEVAWYADNSGNHSHAVGRKRPNRLGLFGTRGNVWERVNDWYDGDYYFNSPPTDPPGPSRGQYRVLRGGSWFNFPGVVHVSCRNWFTSDARVANYGFRSVWEADRP